MSNCAHLYRVTNSFPEVTFPNQDLYFLCENMSQPPVIRNLKEFLEPILSPGTTVLNYRSKFLTAPGDNYGSTMLAVTVDVADVNNKVRFCR